MKNVLVFPCGSEIGLEIYRSVSYSSHFNLFGGNSVNDHGKFVYKNYIGDIPFLDEAKFVERINSIIEEFNIELIYPTMDAVIAKLWQYKDQIKCTIVGSGYETSSICLSKKKTSALLKDKVAMPDIYAEIGNITNFPVFLKPEIGYSSRGTGIAYSLDEIKSHLVKQPDCLVMEFLPGEEYTVDCFSDKNGELIFFGSRLRGRITNGISVNTSEAGQDLSANFKGMAETINANMKFRGAWFFQAKRSRGGNFKLMEVAARLGGSSALYRAKGVNFALLSLWDAINVKVAIIVNDYKIEMDRALDNKFKIEVNFNKVYVDFDDTIIIKGKINTGLIAFLYQCKNENKLVICISRCKGDLMLELQRYRIREIFDEIIHLTQGQVKSHYISKNAIFIDDSFAERLEVSRNSKVSVFAPDMVSALIK